MHHAILDRWLQFGGHADGNPDITAVALREAEEESGITSLELVMPQIFDVDVHEIPANPKRGEPAHLHYDIRYLIRAKTQEFVVSSESKSLQWFSAKELSAMKLEPSMQRMAQKWAKKWDQINPGLL